MLLSLEGRKFMSHHGIWEWMKQRNSSWPLFRIEGEKGKNQVGKSVLAPEWACCFRVTSDLWWKQAILTLPQIFPIHNESQWHWKHTAKARECWSKHNLPTNLRNQLVSLGKKCQCGGFFNMLLWLYYSFQLWETPHLLFDPLEVVM